MTYSVFSKTEEANKIKIFCFRRSDAKSNWDNFESMLKEKFPEDHPAIDQFMSDFRKCKLGSLALGMYKILPIPLLKLMMFFGLHNKVFKGNALLTQSVRDYMENLTQNKKLRCVLSYCFGDYGKG